MSFAQTILSLLWLMGFVSIGTVLLLAIIQGKPWQELKRLTFVFAIIMVTMPFIGVALILMGIK